jgi:hypothetical protein
MSSFEFLARLQAIPKEMIVESTVSHFIYPKLSILTVQDKLEFKRMLQGLRENDFTPICIKPYFRYSDIQKKKCLAFPYLKQNDVIKINLTKCTNQILQVSSTTLNSSLHLTSNTSSRNVSQSDTIKAINSTSLNTSASTSPIHPSKPSLPPSQPSKPLLPPAQPSKPLHPPTQPSKPTNPNFFSMKPQVTNISNKINVINKPVQPRPSVNKGVINKNMINQSTITAGVLGNGANILNKTIITNKTIIKPILSLNTTPNKNNISTSKGSIRSGLITIKLKNQTNAIEIGEKRENNSCASKNYYNTSNITIINQVPKNLEGPKEPWNGGNSSQSPPPVVLFINNEIPGPEHKEGKLKFNKVEKLINKLVQKKLDRLMGNFIESLSKNFEEKIFNKREIVNTNSSSTEGNSN